MTTDAQWVEAEQEHEDGVRVKLWRAAAIEANKLAYENLERAAVEAAEARERLERAAAAWAKSVDLVQEMCALAKDCL